MAIKLNAADSRPLYLQIIDEIRRAIILGTLQEGDSLPSVRELASELVVNPRTVSQAYKELEIQGIAEVRRGQGTFVTRNVYSSLNDRIAVAKRIAKKALADAKSYGVSTEQLLIMIGELTREKTGSSISIKTG